MTEDQKNVVQNILKDCIDDGKKTEITPKLIRDKLNENGMKAIVMTAGRTLSQFAIKSSAETMKYSTWDLGKFGIYDIIMVQYVSNLYKLECTKGNMSEDHKKVVKNALKDCINDGKTKMTTKLIR
eukprot:137444_1